MHVCHAFHMHEPGTAARILIWTCDVWWAGSCCACIPSHSFKQHSIAYSVLPNHDFSVLDPANMPYWTTKYPLLSRRAPARLFYGLRFPFQLPLPLATPKRCLFSLQVKLKQPCRLVTMNLFPQAWPQERGTVWLLCTSATAAASPLLRQYGQRYMCSLCFGGRSMCCTGRADSKETSLEAVNSYGRRLHAALNTVGCRCAGKDSAQSCSEVLARGALRGVAAQHAQHRGSKGAQAALGVRGEAVPLPRQQLLPKQLPLQLQA